MDDGLIVERNPGIVARELKEARGAVLLDPHSTAYHSVNEMGARIWALLDRPTRLAELIDRLAATVEDPPRRLRDDVASYVDELARRGLVRVRPPERG